MQRYEQRIADGSRHPGHFDASASDELRHLLTNQPAEWIDLAGERFAVDTTRFGNVEFAKLTTLIQDLIRQ
jgi:hypothetical protein